MCQCVPDFLSYVSDKYYLNWFTVQAEKVITKTKGWTFYWDTVFSSYKINKKM